MVKAKEKVSLKNPLLKKKVKISLLSNITSALYKHNPDMGTLTVGGAKSFTVPRDKSGFLVNPLTKEEQEFFENLLGIDLNVYKVEGNFWTSKEARVILRKVSSKNTSADLILDLSNPYDYLKYKVALVNPRVANSWAERDSGGKLYEFVIIDEEAKFEEELGYTEMEDTVVEFLLKNKNSKKKLFDLLRIYGVQNANKQVDFSSKTEWLYTELRKASRRRSEVKSLYNLISLGEKEISDKVFLQDCISVGLVEKRGVNEYHFVNGSKFANNEMEATDYFNDKKNQSTRARFEVAIEKYYKTK